MEVHTFNPSILEQKHVDLFEFEASPVYIGNETLF